VRITRDQAWSLAPLHGALACVRPGFHMAGNIGKVNFPAWLGRNSSANKRMRLLHECAAHMHAHISGSGEEVRQAYIPALRGPLLAPLRTHGVAGIDETLGLMDAYSLSKDDFDTIMEMQLLPAGGAPDITHVPTNAKSALTRKYNKTHLAVQKLKGAAAAARNEKRFDEDGAGDDDAVGDDDEHDDDDDDDDKLVKQKAKPVAAEPRKGKGKAKAK